MATRTLHLVGGGFVVVPVQDEGPCRHKNLSAPVQNSEDVFTAAECEDCGESFTADDLDFLLRQRAE